jgi:hypothetical protein
LAVVVDGLINTSAFIAFSYVDGDASTLPTFSVVTKQYIAVDIDAATHVLFLEMSL